MRLTLYTDYTLRVLMYLALKQRDGEGLATIDQIAAAYGISRHLLTKIVQELGRQGFIETLRGRAGGMRLARPAADISIGAVVRVAEEDFAVVACHDGSQPHGCAVFPACRLRLRLAKAVEAFLAELDGMTLDEAIGAPVQAAMLLGIRPAAPSESRSRSGSTR